MSLFSDVSINAKSCADNVVRKADAAVEISRLKLNESRLSREISNKLKFLGAKVYKAYNTDEASPDISEDVCAVSDMYEQIKCIRLRIKELKETAFSAENKD